MTICNQNIFYDHNASVIPITGLCNMVAVIVLGVPSREKEYMG